MPLENLEVIRTDGTKIGIGYTNHDFTVLTHPKSRAKIFRQFEKTPFIFNLVVVMDEWKRMCRQCDLETLLNRKLITENRITVAYASNVTSNYKPMTAWILAHRLGHAIEFTEIVNDRIVNDRYIDRGIQKIFTQLCAIFNEIRKDKVPPLGFIKHPFPEYSLSSHIVSFSNVLLTMRSARNASIRKDLDIVPELLAQYLLTGRVRFNRVDDWDLSRMDVILKKPDSVNRIPQALVRPLNQIDSTKINAMIAAFEAETNAICEQTWNESVGKFLSF